MYYDNNKSYEAMQKKSNFVFIYNAALIFISLFTVVSLSYLVYVGFSSPSIVSDEADEIKVTIDAGLPETGAEESYRAFLTAATFDGNLGNISGADDLCQAQADSSAIPGGLKGKYRAWVSSLNVSARERIVDVQYYLVNSTTLVLNGKSDLDDGRLQNPLYFNQHGNYVPGGYAGNYMQTGTDNDGSSASNLNENCNNWTSDTNYGCILGNSDTIDLWSNVSKSDDCSVSYRLYCFEVDKDEDGYDADNDCDDTDPKTHPGATELCDGKDNNCDGSIPPNESDKDSDGYMVCEGDCDDNDSRRHPGAKELCNGKDDNCDGNVPSNERDNDKDGYRICEGDCNDSNKNINPGATEVCDNVDNDCDGKKDENLRKACGTSVGICTMGEEVCSNGVWSDCSGVQPYEEECDGLDNDCDGETDEGCYCDTGDSQVCGTDIGECKKGTQQCVNGTWGSCVGSVFPVAELCDGKDNDCDGEIDEDLKKSCGTDIGACKSGTALCKDGKWTKCKGKVSASKEICDEKDNDCDGTIDEGCSCTEGKKRFCGISTGECMKGVQECVDGKWSECQGSLSPRDEICDDIDNDCDGEIDEDQVCQYADEQVEEDRSSGYLFYKRLGRLLATGVSELWSQKSIPLLFAFLISSVPIAWALVKYGKTRKKRKSLEYRRKGHFKKRKTKKKSKSPLQ